MAGKMTQRIERRTDQWGRVHFHADDAIELLFCDSDITKLNIDITPEIEHYNNVCIEHDKNDYLIQSFPEPELSPEEDALKRQATWWIPEEYAALDVRAKLLSLCQTEQEIARVEQEMDMFEERNFIFVLRLMCYLVDHWRKNEVVWGVGRGSSVASYCLFLIGVHKINSLAYNLSINEFLK